MLILQDYTATEKIYEGITSVLYRGHRNADQLPVAVKLLKSEYPDPRELAKIRHEHAVMRDLRVPGIPVVIEVGKHGNGLALIMEDSGGRSLSDMIRSQRLSLAPALRIVASVADIIDSVHQRHVIHKDIKPHNILVDPETMQVKLIDFGIATRLSRENQVALAPDALEGTLAYMSPEQTGRMNRVVDHRSDLYSLGVTLYEMLTGALPFQANDAMELVHHHIARRPVPPAEVNAQLPPIVSDIVMKLLAKSAEARYQSGAGLKADLEDCLSQLEATGQIQPFVLGRLDRVGELRIIQKLYGREEQAATLLAAFDRASRGSVELLLVSGEAGVGKSALVQEVHKALAHRRAYCIAGAFAQIGRSTPYASVASALRSLVRNLLAERTDALDLWKAKLLEALGPNGQVLIDLVPELELVIGPQPAVTELGPTESQNRFNLVFQNFLRIFATREHPVVLALEDLQWADAASLNLIHTLMTGPGTAHLLVIGTTREGEVAAAHPLRLLADALRSARVAVHTIAIEPLERPAVAQIVAEALDCAVEQAAPLSEVVFEKTRGNPFFVNQFLRALRQEELLRFDARSRSWTWDLAPIQAMKITDNVVALMAGKLQELAPDTQRALMLAACVGHEFELEVLSVLCDRSRGDTAADLWEALRDGLIHPTDSEYRFVHGPARSDAADDEPSTRFNVSYRFLHDRVQQAAYSLLDDERRKAAHLRIGRLLLARAGSSPRDDALFAVANQVNLAADLISEPGERVELARLNLAAGRRAKAANAHQAAADYLAAGTSLLGEASWERDGDLMFALCVTCAECEYMCGHFDRAESLFDLLLSRASSTLERAQVHNLRIILYLTLFKVADCMSVGRAGLALFGIELPRSEEQYQAALDAELAEVPVHLGSRRIEELVDAPELEDQETLTVLELLTNLSSPAYLTDARLAALVTAKQVNLSLRHGHSEVSAFGFVLYGLYMAVLRDRYDEAQRFGRLGLALDRRFNNVELACKIHFTFGVYAHFFSPLSETIELLRRGLEAGMVSADFPYLSYTCNAIIMARLGLGEELASVKKELDRFLGLMARTKNALSTTFLTIARQMVACLEGRTEGRAALSDDDFNEAELVATFSAPSAMFAACWYHVVKLQLLFLDEEHAAALSAALEAERTLGSSMGYFSTAELSFYVCLTLTALGEDALGGPARSAAMLEEHHAKLARWAESCPENYRHKHLLVGAERSRLSGDELTSMARYEEAIEAAQQSGFTRDEALASELYAKFHLAKGRDRTARFYLTSACYGYVRWGATAKAQSLVDRYPELALQPAVGSRRADGTVSFTVSSTSSSSANTARKGVLDVTAMIRAAQVIAGEVELDNVLEQLMRIAVENAGARKGALVLERGERLVVEALATVDPDVLRTGMTMPVEDSADIAASVVQYVARTREPVILVDAIEDGRFAADPYIVASRPRSVLCMSMVHRGRLTGVLYLENDVISNAFTAARIELLGLLLSQATIAVENALLYAHLQHRTEELRVAGERLEIELAERARSEQTRASLQEEIIRVQNDRLAELSTPLIPITDRIMVMPLIGTMDAARAEQVLHTALQGVDANDTQVVILDITGVKSIDTSVAASLISTASALRLLGAQAVITGVRGDVAQTLVALDVDFGAIVTKGTLQSGIAYALEQSRRTRRLS
ncbi:AAA family ATPase [Sorangium sp. So ce1014]|uniref:protein kinase domain-containing protein n=1 Tax=Sorangium sp. So ce1014 TaxID=3133326 RepID=UPI003F611E24